MVGWIIPGDDEMIPFRYKASLVSKFKVALGAAARRFLRWHGGRVPWGYGQRHQLWQGSDLILACKALTDPQIWSTTAPESAEEP